MTIKEIKEKLESTLTHKRFVHSLGTSDVAGRLAELYGADKRKAEIAGVLHDCAKELTLSEMQKTVEQEGRQVDDAVLKRRALLHGPAGSVLAKTLYGVYDKEIAQAIYFHTTGRPDMTMLEKIVFLSDYIEPSRDFSGVDQLREKAEKNLDEAVMAAYNSTIRYLLDSDEYIYELTFLARNDLILKKENK